jgi:transcriptional regulator with XRE-family HTH domain
MKDTRTEIHIIDGVEHSVEAGTPELCDLLKEVRTKRGLSIRELARRAGVSAGQLSRIEAGDVDRPSVGTLEAIAGAVARPAAPLLFLAGHIGREELERRTAELVVQLDAVSSELDVLSEPDGETVAQTLWQLADHDLPPIGIGNETWREIRRDIEEVAAAWTALTPERRRLALAFVSDQEILSSLDRMPSPPGRYEMEMELRPRVEPEGSNRGEARGA